MAGRGAQSFKKRQKEQQRREKQQEKFAKRMQRKLAGPAEEEPEIIIGEDGLPILPPSEDEETEETVAEPGD
jgi:hypothetical protein